MARLIAATENNLSTSRPTIDELRQRCPKSGAAHLGNWMARRIARPIALHITWVVIPWGMTAHTATLIATLAAMAAAVVFGFGTPLGCLIGVVLLQLWYLLDHVDGQLARYHGTASLDGVQLDYLMHHLVNVIVPVGVGWGLFINRAQPAWALLGFTWGLSLLSIGLWHDCRYKAFVQRLKWVRGELNVRGASGAAPAPQTAIPASPIRKLTWTLRKLCEIHVVMNVLSVAALLTWGVSDTRLWFLSTAVIGMGLASGMVAVGGILTSLKRQSSEQEFAVWFQVPANHSLVAHNGWWCVEPQDHASGD